MFGKKDKDNESDTSSNPRTSTDQESADVVPGSPGNKGVKTNASSPTISSGSPFNPTGSPISSRRSDDLTRSAETSKKRRSSSAAKAKEIFSNAKNSILHGDKDGPQTPMQKLSKTDAALSVPTGSLNNSAGESQPTARSSFLVGVTEDKNKKCRRTMEDTHAYLYNFLGTPAPVLPTAANRPGSLKSKSSNQDSLNRDVSSVSETSQHVVETDNGYFAIFDGHAGTFAAEWCGKKLHVILEDLMRKNPNQPVPELLDQAYTLADQQLEKLPLKNSGTTAITAVLRWEDRVPNNQSATGSTAIAAAAAAALKASEPENSDSQAQPDPSRMSASSESASAAVQKVQDTATRQRVLYTANVGDARIVLCRNGKALRLSYDHKGNDENEGKRITKQGGLILNNRVNGVLAVTRALGDSYLKDLVTGHPYTTETVVQPDQDEFLILACDGLWDVCSDQEAVDLIRNVHDPQEASKIMVDHALARFSTDNLSVMIVRFDSRRLQSNTGTDIGIASDPVAKTRGAVSEVEMLVGEAKRHSTDATAVPDGDSDEVKEKVFQDIQEEEQEPGPELRPEGGAEAEKIMSEKKQVTPQST